MKSAREPSPTDDGGDQSSLRALTTAAWTVGPRQDSPCTLEGFYAVGPLAVGPPVAYVFGKEEAQRIAAGPDLLEALKDLLSGAEARANGDATRMPAGTAAARAAISQAEGS